MRKLVHIALVVNDYDHAIEFYTKRLNFVVVEDTQLSEDKRWVLLSPDNNVSCNLLLVLAKNEEQRSRIGNQTGGRVFLFLHTDDFEKDFQSLLDNNIKIVKSPVQESYGKVAVFEDCYGNLWDLIQPT